MRKAQVTINVTWLFAILAGIAVFALIISFSGDFQEQSEAETRVTLLQNFESKMTSLANTRNTFESIDMSDNDLQVLCPTWQESSLRLSDSPDSVPTPYQAIFSQEQLEGSEVLTWTQDWHMPNRIDRFLYLSSPNTLFVVVRDSAGGYQDFLDHLPEGFPVGVIDYSNITEYGNRAYDNYRFVFFNESPSDITSFDENSLSVSGDISAVNIKPKGGYGAIQFYRLDGTFLGPTTSQYVGDALKYGAIFSEDIQHYDCNREKALFKLKTQAELSLKRTKQIMKELAGDQQGCQSPPFGPQCAECLRIMEDLPMHYDRIRDAAQGGLSEFQAEKIHSASTNITSITQDLRKGRDCPTQ